jgi:hypothetical protein
MKPVIVIGAVGLIVAFVIFVARGQAPLGPSTVESPAAVAAPPAAAPAAPTYERKGRRDPFEPVPTPQGGVSPSVASAQLRGILRGQTPRVLVETADGLGYILAVGDSLGEGRLIEIGSDSAVFRVPARAGSTNDRIVLRLLED